MSLTIELVDESARVALPPSFANAHVVVEAVSESEIRIRKAATVIDSWDDQSLKPLSDRDRDLVLSLLDNPPEPAERLVRALREHEGRHGRLAD